MYHGNYLGERLRAGQARDEAVFLVNDATGMPFLMARFLRRRKGLRRRWFGRA